MPYAATCLLLRIAVKFRAYVTREGVAQSASVGFVTYAEVP